VLQSSLLRLDLVADFPPLPRGRGDMLQLGEQGQEGASESMPAFLVGEMSVLLRLAAALLWAREKEVLGFPGEGHGDSGDVACWAGPSPVGPCWTGLAPSSRERAKPSDAGHVDQGQNMMSQMLPCSTDWAEDGFTPPPRVLKWRWLLVGTLDWELGFPAAARDIQRHRLRAKHLVSVCVDGTTERVLKPLRMDRER
jgi:hypothetical protein